MIRDTETLAALTYSMANRYEAIIAADCNATKLRDFLMIHFLVSPTSHPNLYVTLPTA